MFATLFYLMIIKTLYLAVCQLLAPVDNLVLSCNILYFQFRIPKKKPNNKSEDVQVQSPLARLPGSQHWDYPLREVKRSSLQCKVHRRVVWVFLFCSFKYQVLPCTYVVSTWPMFHGRVKRVDLKRVCTY